MRTTLGLLIAAFSFLHPAVRAQAPLTWINPGTGNWNEGTNWSTGTVPDDSVGAHIYNNGTALVTDTRSVSFFTVGAVASSTGTTLEVSGAGYLTALTSVSVGMGGGAGTLRIRDGGTVVSANTNSTIIAGQGSGSIGTIVLSAGGVLTSDGPGLALGWNHGSGILQIGEGGAAGTLTVHTIAGGVFGGSGQIIFNHNEAAYTFGTQIGDSSSPAITVIHDGPGTTLLTNTASTYTGGTVLNAGVLSVSANANLGAASGTLTFDGGTLRVTGAGFTMDRATTLAAGGGAFDVAAGTLTQQGAITGAGVLTKTGAGILTLSGDNTYIGGTRTTGGLLEADSDTALGTGTAAVDDTAAQDATLRINDGVTAANVVVLRHGGTLDNRGVLSPGDYTTVYLLAGGGVVLNTGELRNDTGWGQAVEIDNATFNTVVNTGGLISGAAGIYSNIAMETTIIDVDGWPTLVTNEGGLHLTNEAGGTIAGTDGTGVSASGGTDNRIVNTGGSLIEGDYTGVWLDTGILRNESGSTIRGVDGIGVSLDVGWINTGSTVTNTGAGSLIEGAEYGVYAHNTDAARHAVVNTAGAILRTSSSSYGQAAVYMTASPWDFGVGSVVNETGSLIEGRRWGVYLDGGGTVTNSGTITGALATGSQNAGVVFNLQSGYSFGSARGTLTNSGTVNGGVRYNNITGTLTNTGVINGNVTMTTGRANQVTLGTGSSIDGALDIGTATNATLTLAGTGSQLYSEAVTGATTFSGSLTKRDAGTWVIDRDLSTTRPVTISGGTLRLGNGGSTGSLAANITNNGALVFGRGDTYTYSGVISGGGAVAQSGPGVTLLTSTHTYTGATTVDAGTLVVNGGLGNTAVTVRDGGTLGGTGVIAGSVTVESGGILAPGSSPGTLTVGSLALQAGSLLDYELGSPGGTPGVDGDLVAVTGDLALGGLLNVTALAGFGEGSYTLITYGGALTGSGADLLFGLAPGGYNLTVDTSVAGQVTLLADYTGLQFWDGAQTTADGAVGGGAGVWDAAAANWTNEAGNANAAWAGLTAVFGGTAGGTVTVADDTQVAGLQFTTDGYTLADGGGRLLISDAATEARLDTGVTAAIETEIAGTGGLEKTGGGTLILAGANTYTGGTTINAGTLQIASDAHLGDAAGGLVFNGGVLATTADLATARDVILNGVGTVDTAASTTLGLAGDVTGAGALVKRGDGALVFTGAATHTGGTTVEAGTLRIGDGTTDGAIAGGITNNAALEFDTAGTVAHAGNITGSGTLTKLGAGTLIFTGSATHTGGTTVEAGTLRIGDGTTDGTIAGGITNNAALEFDTAGTVAHAGDITGSGALTKRGAGALVFTGAATHTGGTTVETGTLRIGDGTTDGSVAGGITNNATLEFDTTGTVAHAGDIAGSGMLTKRGAGTLTLTGDSTYTGDTLVGAGRLFVNGSLGSTHVTVENGALLGGSGSVGGNVTVRDGGVFSPGNSPGIFTIGGDLVFEAGSIARMEINGQVAGVDHDQLVVGGTARLAGTLEILLGYTPRAGDSFVLIDAGAITGDFDVVNGLGNALAFETTVTGDYTLKITAVQTGFSAFTGTPNQRAVAQNIDGDWSNPALADVVDHLNSLPGAALPAAYDRIAPEEYAALPGIARHNTRSMWASLRRRLAEVRAGAAGWSTAGLGLTDRTAPLLAAVGDTAGLLSRDLLAAKQAEAPRRGFFVSGTGTFGGEDAGSVPGYDFVSGSLLAGADANLAPDLAVGVMAGYGHTRVDPDSGGSIQTETARLGLYGTWTGASGLWLNASAGGAYHWHDTRRAALGGTATGSPEATEFDALLEAGRDFTKDGWTLTPSAGLDYVWLRMDGFDERGSLAPLSVASQDSDSLRGELALTLSRRIQKGTTTWDAWARAGWAHEFLDTRTAVRSRLASGAGGVFSVRGNRAPRDGAVLAAGLQGSFGETLTASLGYSGDYNADYRTHSVSASFRFRF